MDGVRGQGIARLDRTGMCDYPCGSPARPEHGMPANIAELAAGRFMTFLRAGAAAGLHPVAAWDIDTRVVEA
eukprot:11115051-Alexandrium_andersonii.AAC.1